LKEIGENHIGPVFEMKVCQLKHLRSRYGIV